MAGLTDAKVRAAKAADKAYKLSDGNQLYLFVATSGSRSWRMNYQFGKNAAGNAVQKTLSIGSYPAITLKDARDARDVAKALLAKGIEPTPSDLFQRGAPIIDTRPTFEDVARDWLKLQAGHWSKAHTSNIKFRMEEDAFPALGSAIMATIDAAQVYDLLNQIAKRGAIETAHRMCQRVSAIFAYAIARGIVKSNPASELKIALPRKPRAKKQPAITLLDPLRQILVDCEAERCRAATKLAMRFLALTAVRPNELHGARWDEFEDLVD